MKKVYIIVALFALLPLYGCESTGNYADETTNDGITAEKIFDKTNEGVNANNESNQQLQNLSEELE